MILELGESEIHELYKDLPPYVRGINVARVQAEVILVEKLFGHLFKDIIISNGGKRVFITDFLLPPEYSPRTTNIIINLPDNYPLTPPGISSSVGIYFRANLKRNGRELTCSRDAFHGTCGHCPERMKVKGWAWWCFARFEGWDPTKDDLVKIILILKDTIENPELQLIE